MNINTSSEKLSREKYSQQLNALNKEDHNKQQELLELLRNKAISWKEFVLKQNERDQEFRRKYDEITKNS